MSADEDRERSEPANSNIFQNASTPKLKRSNFPLLKLSLINTLQTDIVSVVF